MMNFDHEIKNQLQNYLLMQGILSNQTVWHAQTGGQTNKVWRLIGEKDLICKLYLETKLTHSLITLQKRSIDVCFGLRALILLQSPISI